MKRIKSVEDLTNYIFEEVEKRDYKLTQLENEIGLSQGMISRWKKTKKGPPLNTILKILEILDIDFYLGKIEESLSSIPEKEQTKEEKLIKEIISVSKDTKLLKFLEMLIRALLESEKTT